MELVTRFCVVCAAAVDVPAASDAAYGEYRCLACRGVARFAVIETAAVDTVRAYLPANYDCVLHSDTQTLVFGTDSAGWTLDGYVLPRLASGLYFGQEIKLPATFLARLQSEGF